MSVYGIIGPGKKNLLMNGDFSITQRGTGWMYTNDSSGKVYNDVDCVPTSTKCLVSIKNTAMDRWQIHSGTAAGTAYAKRELNSDLISNTLPDGKMHRSVGHFRFVGCTSGGKIAQRIEVPEFFWGKTLTLSFYASAATTFSVSAYSRSSSGYTGNKWSDRYNSGSTKASIDLGSFTPSTSELGRHVFPFVVPTPSSWPSAKNEDEFFSIEFHFPADASTYDIALTNVKLEEGNAASYFDLFRNEDRTACLRYYEHSYEKEYYPGTKPTSVGCASTYMNGGHGEQDSGPMIYSVRKRIQPDLAGTYTGYAQGYGGHGVIYGITLAGNTVGIDGSTGRSNSRCQRGSDNATLIAVPVIDSESWFHVAMGDIFSYGWSQTANQWGTYFHWYVEAEI